MKKILVGKLRDTIELDNIINDTIEVRYNGLTIQVKKYLPIENKIELISSAYKTSAESEDGLLTINKNITELAMKSLIISYYTNLTLPKDPFESYDLLMSTELYDIIVNTIPESEIKTIYTLLENHIKSEKDKHEQKSKFNYMIKSVFKELAEYMDNMIESMENFDPEKLDYITNFLKLTKGD